MSSPPEPLEFTLRSSIFDRQRKLTIHSEYLEFDDKDTATATPTRFLKEDLEALRYGIKAIRGYRFRIGGIYCIDIRSGDGRMIKLRLKSVYRVRLRKLHDKHIQIINALYKYYFHDIQKEHIQRFMEDSPFDLLGVSIDKEGVLFDKKVGHISWDFLGIKRYWTYFTLFSEMDPTQYRAFEFMTEWNAGVLYGVIQAILKIKFPKRNI